MRFGIGTAYYVELSLVDALKCFTELGWSRC